MPQMDREYFPDTFYADVSEKPDFSQYEQPQEQIADYEKLGDKIREFPEIFRL